MTGALRRQVDTARARARSDPARLDRAVEEGVRLLERRVAAAYAVAVTAVVVLITGLALLTVAVGGMASGTSDPEPDGPQPTDAPTTSAPTEPDPATPDPTAPALIELAVAPAEVVLEIGATQQLDAIGRFSDDSTGDLTGSAAWGSGDAAIASVDDAGLVTAVAPGQTTVTGTVEGIEDTVDVLVTEPEVTLTALTIDPAAVATEIGGTQQLTATGAYSDDSTADLTDSVAWAARDTAIASVDESGLLTALAPGQTTVTATLDSIEDTIDVVVTEPEPDVD